MLLATACGAPGHGAAQGVDCQALRAEIASLGQAPTTPDEWSSAVRRQRQEIARTRAYASSLGCQDTGLFGGAPPECDMIDARLRRMQDNLAQLEVQSQVGGGDARRRALTERFNAACGRAPLDSPSRSAFDAPGGGNLDVVPVDPSAPALSSPSIMVPPDGEAPPAAAASKVVCVRTCDGGFFPMAYHATSDKFEELARLCQAQCPNAPVALYSMGNGEEIDKAQSVADGTPYSQLPTAFRYQKTFDPACACRAPNKSWAETLSSAEKMIEAEKGDVTVTPQMSDAMARPGAPVPPPPRTKAAKVPRKVRAAPETASRPTLDATVPPAADAAPVN